MEGRTYLREVLRGHADGGGGDEALEVGRGRRRRRRGGSVPPELRFRRRLRGAVQAVGGRGGDAGDGHGRRPDGVGLRTPREASRASSGLGLSTHGRRNVGCERGQVGGGVVGEEMDVEEGSQKAAAAAACGRGERERRIKFCSTRKKMG
jgi:hypothetical protein